MHTWLACYCPMQAQMYCSLLTWPAHRTFAVVLAQDAATTSTAVVLPGRSPIDKWQIEGMAPSLPQSLPHAPSWSACAPACTCSSMWQAATRVKRAAAGSQDTPAHFPTFCLVSLHQRKVLIVQYVAATLLLLLHTYGSEPLLAAMCSCQPLHTMQLQFVSQQDQYWCNTAPLPAATALTAMQLQTEVPH